MPIGRNKIQWSENQKEVGTSFFVFINGNYVGKCKHGYTNFCLDLTRYIRFGQENKLKVTLKNGIDLNARWYPGEGLYRNVNLYVTEYSYIQLDGVKISTPSVEEDVAEVLINTEIVCEDRGYKEMRLLTEICDDKGNKVIQDNTPVTIGNGQIVQIRQHMFIDTPKLWSLEFPNLYFCESKLISNDQVIDEAKKPFWHP